MNGLTFLYRTSSPEAGASPGKFFTSSAEYQRRMQDAVTDPDVETIVLMLCSQSGKTQLQLNAVGFYNHYEPSPSRSASKARVLHIVISRRAESMSDKIDCVGRTRVVNVFRAETSSILKML